MKAHDNRGSRVRGTAALLVVALLSFLAGAVWVQSGLGGRIASPIRAWFATATSTATLTLTPTRTPTAAPTVTSTPRPTRIPRPTPVSYPDGQLLYVRHEPYSRGRGLPDTYQYYLFRFEPAPPGSDLREYIRAVQRLAVPNLPEQEFEQDMAGFWAGNRALSNDHDYRKKFAVGPVITGGAMLKATGNSMWKAGRQFVEVYALDPQRLPPVPARLEDLDWTLHFRPTIVTQVLGPDGRWDVDPFPYFGGWGIAPVIGRGGRQWINAAYVVPIAAAVGPFDYP